MSYWIQRLGDSEDSQYAINCMLGALDPSTIKSYAGKWNEYEHVFCKEHGLTPLLDGTAADSTAQMIKYVGWQGRKGTVQGSSIDNYLYAINRAHTDFDLPPPANMKKSRPLQNAIDGMTKQQTKLSRNTADILDEDQRIFLPAAIPAAILHDLVIRAPLLDLTDQAAVTAFREELAVVFNYADWGRPETQAKMQPNDIEIDMLNQLFFRTRSVEGKSKQRQPAVFMWPPSANPQLVNLMSHWKEMRFVIGCSDDDEHAQMWRLPWEKTQLTSRNWNIFLQNSLTRHGFTAPGNFKYTAYSTRKGPATEANALNVSYAKICHQGGWSDGSRTPQQKYIDPSHPPTPAGRLFFGWLCADAASPST